MDSFNSLWRRQWNAEEKRRSWAVAGGSLSELELKSVLGLDPNIRYVILFGQDGKPLTKVNRPEASLHEPPEQTAAILQRFAIARGMTLGSDTFYGKAKTIIVRRDRLTELVFPIAEQLVLVGTEPGFPLEKTSLLENTLTQIQVGRKRK
jgi:hypothetical protein